MKWYFCMERRGLLRFENCIRVALHSCRKYTSLKPVCVWYDEEYQIPVNFHEMLERYGVEIVLGRGLIYQMAQSQGDSIKVALNHAVAGSYLRYEIPFIENEDEFVFYADVDVIFQSELDFSNIKPRFFAAAPEFNRGNYGYINSGIMVMNMENMRQTFQGYAEVVLSRMRAGFCVGTDQGDLNAFYFHEWNRLDEIYNWKPYWGVNPDAKIIHFHGPKPDDYVFLMKGTQQNDLWKSMIDVSREGYAHYTRLFLETMEDAGEPWIPKQMLA